MNEEALNLRRKGLLRTSVKSNEAEEDGWLTGDGPGMVGHDQDVSRVDRVDGARTLDDSFDAILDCRCPTPHTSTLNATP